MVGALNGFSRSELAVLEVIRTRRQATRADVAEAAGLSPAMAARLVSRLQDTELVREAGATDTTRPGRPARLVEIAPDAAYVVGIDIGTEVLHILVADLHGMTRAYLEVPSSQLANKSQAQIVAALASLVRDIIDEAAVPADRVAVICTAISGIIDSRRGICLLRSYTPGWEEFPLVKMLSARLGRPVLLEETSRAKAVAEQRRGVAGDTPHFLYIDAGTVIGAGIVIDGKPYYGDSGLAGELGHVIVDPNGGLCRCGNRGCVQACASARAVVAEAQELLRKQVLSTLAFAGENLTLADVAAAADAGDRVAIGLLTMAGERLGHGISAALNILGLSLVVLGGPLARSGPVVVQATDRIMQLHALPVVRMQRRLVLSGLGSDAGAIGAALEALDWLFGNPRAAFPASTLTSGLAQSIRTPEMVAVP